MTTSPIAKLLIANRGEIARRVIRSARGLGIRTVAVFSDADADAPHVAEADEAVRIGGPTPAESYLNVEALLAAAQRTGADAIHPGYGFVAENAAFARACAEAGVTFVGPPPDAIAAMGDKVVAKRAMIEAGVPTVPGYQGEATDDATLAREAERIGVPLLVKAAAGGGGRGMRRVEALADFAEAVASARAEAESAFGDGSVFLERLVTGARHVELQVMCDAHGGAIHLGERECSVQRRHQKIIEEAPSPVVDAALRAKMGEAAVAAAKTIGYVGAGTVEFLLDDDGAFYFLEMNTRLQVEHPVTELVTGLDLVAMQLRVAEGEKLPLSQADVTLRGHAIEARIYAEDPYAGFLPQLGPVLAWRPATGEGVRVDDGIVAGQTITPHYDAMVAKVIAYGPDRATARRRLVAAVEDSVLLGPGSNREFLADLLRDEAFVAGDIRTDTIDARMRDAPPDRPRPDVRTWAAAAVLASVGEPTRGRDLAWHSAADRGWPVALRLHEQTRTVEIAVEAGTYTVHVGDETVTIRIVGHEGGRARLEIDGVHETVWYAATDDGLAIDRGGAAHAFVEPRAGGAEEAAGDGTIRAPIAGTVRRVDRAVGDRVEAGATLAMVEAMKMEHRVQTRVTGTVAEVRVAPGDQVTARQVMLVVTPDDSETESEASS